MLFKSIWFLCWTVNSKHLDSEGHLYERKALSAGLAAFILRNSYIAKVFSLIVRTLVSVTPIH